MINSATVSSVSALISTIISYRFGTNIYCSDILDEGEDKGFREGKKSFAEYMDPEYYRRMKLTKKSDVYSFGVVLLEVIYGRAAVDRRLEYEEMNLANWARQFIEKGRLVIDEIIDPVVVGQIAGDCLNKFGQLAFQCLRDEGILRPTMADVWHGLN